MITETKGYKTCDADGKNVLFHATLEAAQEYSIADLLCGEDMESDQSRDVAAALMKHKSELLTILTGKRGKDKQPRKKKNNPDLIAPRPG